MRAAALSALILVPLCAAPAGAWRLFGEPSDGRIRPAQALSDQGKAAEVVAALTPQFMQTLRGTDLRQAHVLLGDNLDVLRLTDRALGVYQVGVKLFPKNVDLLTRQAGLLHRTGLDDQAKPLFLRALALEPRHFGAHLGLAEIDRRMGFLDDSAAHYEAALDTLDKRADVWRDYAEVLLAGRRYKDAESAVKRAASLAPREAQAFVLKGFVRRAQDDLNGAVAALDEALALGAGVPALRAKALWLLEAGRAEEALAAAQAVLKDQPQDDAALWVRARLNWAAGRTDKALEDLDVLAVDGRRDGFPARAARALGGVVLKDGGRAAEFPPR